MASRKLSRSLRALLAAGLLVACAHGSELDALDVGTGGIGAATGGSGGSGLAPGSGGSAPTPGVGGAGSGGAPTGGAAGAGLTSSVLDPDDEVDGSAGAGPACDYSESSGCDFERVTGCCSALACEKASGANVFDTYPVESCEALVACVQANPGCSTAEDPLCFQDEAPTAPCLREGYQASHTDPDGPFAWTVELMNCLCGY